MDKTKIEEIKESWRKETDEWVLKAATKNINEYPPEIRIIIREEAVKRDLIAYEVTEAGSNGLGFDVMITEKGDDILIDAAERAPKVVSVKLAKTIFIFLSVAAVVGVVGLVFGLPEGILAAVGGYASYMVIKKIWPSEEERKRRRQEKRQALKWAKDHPEEFEKLAQEKISEIFKDYEDDRPKDKQKE